MKMLYIVVVNVFMSGFRSIAWMRGTLELPTLDVSTKEAY